MFDNSDSNEVLRCIVSKIERVNKTVEFTYHYLSACWAHLQNVTNTNARLWNAEDDREKNKIYKELKMDTTDEKKDDLTSLCIDDQIDQCGQFKSGFLVN